MKMEAMALRMEAISDWMESMIEAIFASVYGLVGLVGVVLFVFLLSYV